MTEAKKTFVIALPKGRILEEALPLFKAADIVPEDAFFDGKARQLSFATNRADIRLVRVRSFDAASFVSSGAADIGVCGYDVLEEYGHDNLYAPVNLHIGACRLSVAAPAEKAREPGFNARTHITVATKYPALTKRFYAARGVQAECVKLNGAMELAPLAGICDRIVDLVSTGRTLKENGLVELEKILDVTSRVIVNRTAYKLYPETLNPLLSSLERRRAA